MFAHLQHHTVGLLLGGLHRHEAHPRTPGGLTDRLGVIAVVLGALHEGLYILWRDQPHGVAKGAEFSSPVMGTSAGLHGDLGGGKFPEEGDHLRAAEVGSRYSPAGVVDAVQREDGLGRVDANAGNVRHGRLRFGF